MKGFGAGINGDVGGCAQTRGMLVKNGVDCSLLLLDFPARRMNLALPTVAKFAGETFGNAALLCLKSNVFVAAEGTGVR